MLAYLLAALLALAPGQYLPVRAGLAIGDIQSYIQPTPADMFLWSVQSGVKLPPTGARMYQYNIYCLSQHFQGITSDVSEVVQIVQDCQSWK